jgi:bis(5'-nucleosidyl)-tetraphosphatase
MAASTKRLSAGAVVVRDTPQGPRFLLLRAYNHWDFPKGLVENGESPRDAALREVREETTIADLSFPWGEQHTETGPYSRGKMARYYLARTATTAISLPVNPETGFAEHSEYRWVDQEAAWRLVSPRVKRVIEWAAAVLGLRLVAAENAARAGEAGTASEADRTGESP